MRSSELLEELVRIPSPSGREGEVAAFIVRTFGGRVDEAGNAVVEFGSGDRTLLLTSHMDTYPTQIPVRRQARVLEGRGSVDNKASLAVFLGAAEKFAGSRGVRVVVVGTTEEEAPTNRGARFLVRSMDEPDFCIVGEPSGVRGVTVGYKGSLGFNVVVEKKNVHFAREPTASAELVSIIRRLEGLAVEEFSFNNLNFEVRRVSGDSERAEAFVLFRLPLGVRVEELKESVLTVAPGAVVNQEIPACVVPKNNVLVRSLLASIREQGLRPVFKKKTGTSDMNILAGVWGCPMVTYGPGDSRFDHAPDERIDLDEVDVAQAIIESVIKKISSGN